MTALPYFLFAALGFALGGVLFSYHIPRLVKRVDVCEESEDHNPGTVNAIQKAGWKIGMVCLLCDLAKGAIPVALAYQFVDPNHLLFSLVIAAPVFGHCFAPWDRNVPGGKGIATAFGTLIALLRYTPIGFALVLIYVFFSLAVKIEPHEKRSALAFFVFSALALTLSYFTHGYARAIGFALFSSVVIYKNLKGVIPADAPVPEEKKPG